MLEGAEAATSFSTGMAAISNTLFTLLSPGDRVVSIKDTYGGTNKLFLEFLPRFQIKVELCDTTDHKALERTIARGCRVFISKHRRIPRSKLWISSASPKPRTQSAQSWWRTIPSPRRSIRTHSRWASDLVLHSATKFLGGHADALGGVVCGPKELV